VSFSHKKNNLTSILSVLKISANENLFSLMWDSSDFLSPLLHLELKKMKFEIKIDFFSLILEIERI